MRLLKTFTKLILNYSCSQFHTVGCGGMACSRYEYVKQFEQDDSILQNVWIVIRLDGKGFHKFTKVHKFEKPNDARALNLMNAAAIAVMNEFRDVVIAYGQSDEYSFVFRKETNVYNRRATKLLSYVCSLFTSSYVMQWSRWLPDQTLKTAPSFDARIVLYPSDQNLRDYLAWRQADVHINNLYNTAFWNLVQVEGKSNQEAEAELRGTVSAEKNELLFSRFNINYNNLPALFRKGTILLRKRISMEEGGNKRQLIVALHEDMIGNKFWEKHNEILGKYEPGSYDFKKDEDILSDKLLSFQIERANRNNS